MASEIAMGMGSMKMAGATGEALQPGVADMYTFLSMSLGDPRVEALDDAYLDALEVVLSSLELSEEAAGLRQWRESEGDCRRALSTEYTRLFHGKEERPLVPLCASAYRQEAKGGDGAMVGDARRFYRQHGYDLTAASGPPDHIKHELEFMAILSKAGKGDAEAEFRRAVFRPWFETFLKEAQQKVTHPFYRISLDLIDVCTQEDE